MTNNDHLGPFTRPLPDPADANGDTIGDQLRLIMYALGEVKGRVANGPDSLRPLVRRLYQLEAAAQNVSTNVFEIEQRVRRHDADVLLATALTGYEVGCDDATSAIHISDINSDNETVFLCGAGIRFSVGNLTLLRDDLPLCETCSIEFTRRVFTPGGLLIDDEEAGQSDADEELDRRLRNLNAYLESCFQSDLDHPRRRAKFLKKLDEMRAGVDTGPDRGERGAEPDPPPAEPRSEPII